MRIIAVNEDGEKIMVAMSELFNDVLSSVRELIRRSGSGTDGLHSLCSLLKDKVPHYDWVGFYFTDPEKENELVLGPYVGEPTEHSRIRFGDGICGQAAEREETFVVQDVTKEDNYLSCSIHVRSEIVVPIIKNGKIVGEIDIDSHEINSFTREDEIFLERLAALVVDHI